jgi:hypothetical protein
MEFPRVPGCFRKVAAFASLEKICCASFYRISDFIGTEPKKAPYATTGPKSLYLLALQHSGYSSSSRLLKES